MALYAAIGWAFAVAAGLLAAALAVYRKAQLQRRPRSDVQLSEPLRRWERRGSYIEVFGHRVFVVRVPCAVPAATTHRRTFVLVHGYPSSSFDYAGVIDALAQHGDVVAHDHVGFGLSARPGPGAFCYSVFEHADVACGVWAACGLGVGGAPLILVAHDMGDSIVAEILARRHRGLLPAALQAPGVVAGALFTNGGMRIRLANLRVAQRAALTPAGPFLARAVSALGPGAWAAFFAAQLRTIWGPCADDDARRARDGAIGHMLELARWNCGGGGDPPAVHVSRAARYLRDRFESEYRWDEALRAAAGGHGGGGGAALPIALLWGDADAVSPLAIPEAVRAAAGPGGCPLTVLPRVGHFLMLEAPAAWVAHVAAFGERCAGGRAAEG